MHTSSKECKPQDALGIFVELAAGTEDVYRYKIQEIMPYRVKLLITLPHGFEKHWPTGICRILLKVEAGNSWPVRFDHENLIHFISMEDMKWIDKHLPSITTYVYGVTVKSERDEERLRRWRNAAQRAAYVSGSRSVHAAPLDGQLSWEWT